jgi:hypothetical protein
MEVNNIKTAHVTSPSDSPNLQAYNLAYDIDIQAAKGNYAAVQADLTKLEALTGVTVTGSVSLQSYETNIQNALNAISSDPGSAPYEGAAIGYFASELCSHIPL